MAPQREAPWRFTERIVASTPAAPRQHDSKPCATEAYAPIALHYSIRPAALFDAEMDDIDVAFDVVDIARDIAPAETG